MSAADSDSPLLVRRRPPSFAERVESWRAVRVQLLIEIKRTARVIDRALAELGEHEMLPERQRRALDYLERCGCSPCISDVARQLRISRQAAQRLVIALQQRRFVAYLHYDRRMVQLRLTGPGRHALRLASGKVLGLLWHATEGLEDRTLERTAAALRAIQRRLLAPPYKE